MAGTGTPYIVIRCPPKHQKKLSTRQRKVGDENQVVQEQVQVKIILPNSTRKRQYSFVPQLELPLVLWPFTAIAMLFRPMAGPDWKSGHKKLWFARFFVPICICPDIFFYIVNFLHAPVVGYLIFVGCYCFAFRASLLGLFTNEAIIPENNYCNIETHTRSPLFGIDVDGNRYILLAVGIVFLIIIGIIGCYTGSKLMLGLWLFMVIVLVLEFIVGFKPVNSLRANRCFKIVNELRYCLLVNIEKYWKNSHSYYEYGPARAIDFIQYSFECCGARGAKDYLVKNLTVPSSCCNTIWNKNINCGSMENGHLNPRFASYVYQQLVKMYVTRKCHRFAAGLHIISLTGCVEKIIVQCRILRGLLTHGLRPIFIFHLFLFIVGVICIIFYFGMLRTMHIRAYEYGDKLRRFQFPRKLRSTRQVAESQTFSAALMGQIQGDGRDKPEDILRAHLREEFIKNKTEDHQINDDLPLDAQAFVDKLRDSKGIGNEKLGFNEFDKVESADKPSAPEPEGELSDSQVVKYVMGKSRIKEESEMLISASRRKYNAKLRNRKLESGPSGSFDLTPEKAEEQLQDSRGVSPKKKSVWKWEEKDRMNIAAIVDKAKEDVNREGSIKGKEKSNESVLNKSKKPKSKEPKEK